MARGTQQSQGRAARSEGGLYGGIGKSGNAFTDGFYVKEVGGGRSLRNKALASVSEETITKTAKALGQIEEKVIPTKPITLSELYQTDPRAYERLTSVKQDEDIGNKKVADEMKELRSSTDTDQRVSGRDGASYVQSGIGKGRRAVVEMANELMMSAYLDNKRDFGNWASTRVSQLTPKFGEEVATRLVNLGLREGYDRMQRAGMTYQEKDPRFSEPKNTGRVARSERPASSAYNPDTQKIRMQAIVDTLERKDLTQAQKAIIAGEIGKGFRDKQIGLG